MGHGSAGSAFRVISPSSGSIASSPMQDSRGSNTPSKSAGKSLKSCCESDEYDDDDQDDDDEDDDDEDDDDDAFNHEVPLS